MSKKIECFEQKIKTIQERLDEIKNQVDIDKRKKDQQEIIGDISDVKQDIQGDLDDLKKDADENVDDIKKLEDLSKTLDSFSGELNSLKDEILKKDSNKENEDVNKINNDKEEQKEKQEGTPSLFAKVFYGGLLANTLGRIPLIGDSIKSWTEKKVKDSAQDDADEKAGKKEKSGFFKRIFKTVLWSGLATGALWLGKKIIPDNLTNTVKNWFGFGEKKEEQKEKPNIGSQNENSKEDQDVDNKEKNENESFDDAPNAENQQIPVEQIVEENSPEDKQATQEVNRMYSEGYSELYILMKMYQMGFIPKFNMETWRGNTLKGKLSYIAEGGPFTKMLDKTSKMRGDIHRRMIGNIKYSQETLLKAKLDAVKNNKLSLIDDYQKKINLLDDMQRDVNPENPKRITSLSEFEKKYGRTYTEKFGRKNFSQIHDNLIKEGDKICDAEKEIKTIERDVDDLQKKAKLELDELEKKAKLDPKQKPKFQAEAKKIIEDYNKKALEAEKKIGLSLSKVTTAELIHLQKESPLVTKIMKINNGVDNFTKNTKIGKFMLGVSVLSLLSKGASGEGSWKQVGLEATDLATGMIPFAGGAYDIWTSITGKGIAGQLSTTDRRIRGSAGAVSMVLDVAGLFTFGAGNAASAGLKAAVKGSTKLAKVAKGVRVGAETINMGMKVATYGFLGYVLVNEAKGILVPMYEKTDKKLTSDISLA